MTNKYKVLSSSFFERPADKVALDLLGKKLVRKIENRFIEFTISEAEAYLGEKDKACHAYKGKTERTKVMYEEGGLWYVYLIYGMHYMLNIVC